MQQTRACLAAIISLMGGVGTSALKTFAEVAKGLGGQARAIVRGCD